MSKAIVATASLAGCFGCHMSILDIDEKILQLIELVEFNKTEEIFTRPTDKRTEDYITGRYG